MIADLLVPILKKY